MDPIRRSACAFLFALLVALPAAAVPIAFLGTFDDASGNESAGDVFVLTNPSASSQSSILQVVIDLRTASQPPVTFDPGDAPVTPTGASAATTGFLAAVLSNANSVLTLTFASFDPGDTFTFTVDVDDNNNRVDAARMAGSLVTATFAAGNTALSTAMVDPPGGGRNLTWSAAGVSVTVPIPEPAALPLLCSGLIALAIRHRAVRQRTRRAAPIAGAAAPYPCSYA